MFLWSQITRSRLSISILMTRSIIQTCWANPVTCGYFVLYINNLIATMFCTVSTGSFRLLQLKTNKKAISKRNVDASGNAEMKTCWRIAYMGRIALKSSSIKDGNASNFSYKWFNTSEKVLKFLSDISWVVVTSTHNPRYMNINYVILNLNWWLDSNLVLNVKITLIL